MPMLLAVTERTPGKRRQLFLAAVEEGCHLCVAVARARQAETEEKNVIRFKPQRNAIQIQQRMHKEPCAHQQNRRQRNLADHQAFIKPELMPIGGCASRSLQSRMAGSACRLPCRRQPEQDAGSN